MSCEDTVGWPCLCRLLKNCMFALIAQALERITPKGHKEVTRKVLGLLANSHSIAVRNFTGFARDVEKPLVGTPNDHGFRRGPVRKSDFLDF